MQKTGPDSVCCIHCAPRYETVAVLALTLGYQHPYGNRIASPPLASVASCSSSGKEIPRNCYSFQSSERIMDATFTGSDRAVQPGSEVAYEGKILHQGN